MTYIHFVLLLKLRMNPIDMYVPTHMTSNELCLHESINFNQEGVESNEPYVQNMFIEK